MIIKHTTTDGNTYHEIDLGECKHMVTENEVTVNKRWGTQQKLVERLVVSEIKKVNEHINTQKMTIGQCIKYGRLDNLDITREKLNLNEGKIEYLISYEYE